MATYNTNNPLGSADPRDLFDNSQIADHLVSDTENDSWTDRFGNARKTWKGIENAAESQLTDQENSFQQFLLNSGYEQLGDYVDGPITFTRRNQITAYNGEFYRPKSSVTLPYTTTGNTATTWATDESNFVAVGDAALRQDISGADGLKYIGRCPDVSTLRKTEPTTDGQVIELDSYFTNSGYGGGKLRYDASLSATDYPDDGVVRFVTAEGKVWTRCVTAGTVLREVPMEWGGVESHYDSDQSALVQSVFDAAETLALNKKSSNSQTRRVSVVPTPKLRCSKTIYFNVIFVQVEGQNSEWAFDSSGSYDNHPTALGIDGTTAQAMCLVARGAPVDGNWVSAAYRNRVDFSNLSVYFATGYEDDFPTTTLSDTNVIGIAFYSLANTLAQAQSNFNDLAIIGFGKGFCNGDYGWGIEFNYCRFSDNYYPTYLIDGLDNGERFGFNGVVMQNNMHGLWNRSWLGHINVSGGSYVWNQGEYFHIGTARGATLRPNHVEYVNSKSPLVTTDYATSGGFEIYPIVTWRGGTLVISAQGQVTDDIVLLNPAKTGTVYFEDVNVSWNAIDLQPNIRIAPDVYQWGDDTGRVFVKSSSMQIGTWGALARCRSQINGGMLSTTGGQAGTNVSDGGGTVSFVKNSDSNYVQFSTSADNASAKYLYLDVPLNRIYEWWACIPVLFVQDVTNTANQWLVQWAFYSKDLGLDSATILGTVNMNAGDIEVYPLNSYGRPVQYLRNQMANAGPFDTCRITITLNSWKSGDTFKLIGGGVITI